MTVLRSPIAQTHPPTAVDISRAGIIETLDEIRGAWPDAGRWRQRLFEVVADTPTSEGCDDASLGHDRAAP
jgi:hypothetical protein